jgi:hypothetical protein
MLIFYEDSSRLLLEVMRNPGCGKSMAEIPCAIGITNTRDMEAVTMMRSSIWRIWKDNARTRLNWICSTLRIVAATVMIHFHSLDDQCHCENSDQRPHEHYNQRLCENSNQRLHNSSTWRLHYRDIGLTSTHSEGYNIFLNQSKMFRYVRRLLG